MVLQDNWRSSAFPMTRECGFFRNRLLACPLSFAWVRYKLFGVSINYHQYRWILAVVCALCNTQQRLFGDGYCNLLLNRLELKSCSCFGCRSNDGSHYKHPAHSAWLPLSIMSRIKHKYLVKFYFVLFFVIFFLSYMPPYTYLCIHDIILSQMPFIQIVSRIYSYKKVLKESHIGILKSFDQWSTQIHMIICHLTTYYYSLEEISILSLIESWMLHDIQLYNLLKMKEKYS